MDLDIVLLSQRKTNTLWYYLYVKSEKKKKRWYKWTYLQNRNKVTDVENKPMVIRGFEV